MANPQKEHELASLFSKTRCVVCKRTQADWDEVGRKWCEENNEGGYGVPGFEFIEGSPICDFCIDKIKERPSITETRVKEDFQRRRKIKSHTRWSVWERDNFTCLTCGSRKNLSIDHIHPFSKGGTEELENLQTLCMGCNSLKSDGAI